MSLSIPVVIPAAGIGRRMRSDTPKQYMQIAGKPVIQHTIERFDRHPQISAIVVVLHPDDQRFSALDISTLTKLHVVVGGDERVDSVLAGLRHLAIESPAAEWVMVHDAARPCVPSADIDNLIASLESNQQTLFDGGLLAMRVRDTMKRGQISTAYGNSESISHTESREHLWHALTPQMFKLQTLIDATEIALAEHALITDEASAMEYCNHAVALVEGSSRNIKITTPDDLKLAEFYLREEQESLCE